MNECNLKIHGILTNRITMILTPGPHLGADQGFPFTLGDPTEVEKYERKVAKEAYGHLVCDLRMPTNSLMKCPFHKIWQVRPDMFSGFESC